MDMQLPPGEPAAGPWRPVMLETLVEQVLTGIGEVGNRPRIVAVDGRGASGKTTLAALLHHILPGSAVIHTDDLAWHEPLFAWGHLLADHVLRPLHRGDAISFQPPAWKARGRDGAIDLPAGLSVVLVEGTGASQREHADLLDATIWVQSDFVEAERRGLARDIDQGVNGDPAEATAFWHRWMAEELAFLQRQEPWMRACVVVNGTPGKNLPPDQVLVGSCTDPAWSGSVAAGWRP